MLKRYIGNISPAKIRIAGQDFGVVETGDAIVVPDELANSVAWPEYNWQDGAPNKVNDDEGDN